MDLNIHIRLGHSDPLLGNFSALLHDAIERALQRATKLLRDAVEHNIRTPFGTRYHPAVAFGDLADSVRRAVYDQGDKQVGHVFLGGPAERYGLFVEVGTRPHWPPVSALIPWVQVKFGLKDLQQIRSECLRSNDGLRSLFRQLHQKKVLLTVLFFCLCFP